MTMRSPVQPPAMLAERRRLQQSDRSQQIDLFEGIMPTQTPAWRDLPVSVPRVAARGSENLMLPILHAVRAYATLGEMCDALREVWGEWEERAAI